MARTATTTAAPARRTVGRPSKSAIKREAIVAVALEQIDKVGVYAFSLRDVARSLDVYPATIYWHVNSKDALLADVAGAVMQEVTPPRGKSSWQVWMRDLFFRYRAAVRKHPNVAQLIGAQLVSNSSLRTDLIDGVLIALLEAGATEENLLEAYNCVISSLIGFMTMELAPMPSEEASQWADALKERVRSISPLDHPTLARYLPKLANKAFIVRWQNGTEVPLDSSFAANVEIFVAGLESFLQKKTQAVASSKTRKPRRA
ncbi:TetR/AcrR family transcriptional regulator [Paraburkholderia sp. BL25I1N1]|uniref:TetR/AcrR family transcriptional regulator n=1 Tax=Paraburkholderia sp. BL25I1N1 TaxID=1938804 RepID=UPI000D077E8E|nr:TetR family transcriptional regulator [Paraburkholderia sp. BL25I1N1]PRX97599.1 TetR family transcriptional regulator [Paraburkholderia sp. BL25I1N1]